MKRKTSNQFALAGEPTPNEVILYRQLKDVTDDLTRALDKGLTINENLAMVFKSLRVNSGVEVDLGKERFATVVGAYIAHTDGATVTSQRIRTSPTGNILITVEVSPSPATITFVLIGG